MDYLQIDETKCRKDGLCAAVCPHQLITMDRGVPQAVDSADQRCVACGHCVAWCPQGAISHGKVPLERCEDLRQDWRLDPLRVGQLIKGRRSVRRFRAKALEREVLLQMMDVARYAPSGFNIQPICWTVVGDREKVRRIAGLVIEWMRGVVASGAPIAQAVGMPRFIAEWEAGNDLITYGAPHLVCAHAHPAAPAGSVSCVAALSYLELIALAHGAGTCWAGFVQMATELPAMREALQLPEQNACHGALMVGYAQHPFRRVPPRKPLDIRWA